MRSKTRKIARGTHAEEDSADYTNGGVLFQQRNAISQGEKGKLRLPNRGPWEKKYSFRDFRDEENLKERSGKTVHIKQPNDQEDFDSRGLWREGAAGGGQSLHSGKRGVKEGQ